MAARTWEADFRYPAIQASIPLIRDGYLDDPFRFDGSFCIPVAERPAVGWTPGKIMLIFLVLGFALLGTGAYLGAQAERIRGEDGPVASMAGFLRAKVLFRFANRRAGDPS